MHPVKKRTVLTLQRFLQCLILKTNNKSQAGKYADYLQETDIFVGSWDFFFSHTRLGFGFFGGGISIVSVIKLLCYFKEKKKRVKL